MCASRKRTTMQAKIGVLGNFCFHGAIFIRVFFLWYKGIVRDERFVADALKTEEKKV